MTDLGEEFNIENNEPDGGFDDLPDGEHTVIAVHSEMVPTKAGTGTLLKFRFQIVEGFGKNRMIFHQFNWSNPNEKAVQISKHQFAELTRACGKSVIKNTDEILNIPLIVVTKTKDEGEWGMQSRIVKFKSAASGGSKAESHSVELPAYMKDDEEDDIPWNL